MSLLNRRKFLTGALFATGAAMATSLVDATNGEKREPEKHQELADYLIQQHPDVAPHVLSRIAQRYSDYAPSALRPAIAATGAGLAYAYFQGEEKLFQPMNAAAAVGGASLLRESFEAVSAAVPRRREIKTDIAVFTRDLHPDKTDAIIRSVSFFLEREILGLPAHAGVAGAMVALKPVERYLDRVAAANAPSCDGD